MLAFDLRTLVLLLAAISVLQAVILLLFSRMVARQYAGIFFWAWGSVCNALGFVLLLLRDIIPDFWTVVAGNTLLVSSTALNAAGINRFVQRPQPAQERIALGLVLGTAVLFVPLTFITPNLIARTVWVSTAIGVLALFGAWNVLRFAPRELRFSYWFTGVVFTASGSLQLIRAGVTAVSTPTNSFFAPSATQTVTLLTSVAILLLGIAGFVAMTIQRLLRDLRLAQDAERAALKAAAQDAEQRVAETQALLAALTEANRIIQEREQLFRLTFDRSPLGAALISPDGRFLRVNKALAALSGYAEADLLQHDAFILLAPDDRNQAMTRLNDLLAGAEPITIEVQAQHADGMPIWLQCTIGLVHDAAGAPLHLLALIEDITGRKRIEQHLRTIERQQQLVLRTIPEQFWFKDVAGRYILASESLARFHGRRPEEFIGRTAAEVFTQELSAFIQIGDDLVRAHQLYNADIQLTDVNGNQRWLTTTRAPVYDDNGVLLGIVGVARDITTLKEAGEALRLREELLRSVSDNMPDGLIYQLERFPDGARQYRYVSAGIERLWGITPQAAYTDPEALWSRIHPDDRPLFDQAAERAHAAMSLFEFEGRVRLPDGRMRWSYIRSTPQRRPDGRVLRSGVELDITARKQAEEALRRRVHELTVLYQITLALTGWTKLTEGLVPVAALLNEVFAAQISIWDYDDQGRCFRLLVAQPALTGAQQAIQLSDLQRAQIGLERPSTVVTPGAPLFSDQADHGAGSTQPILFTPLRIRNELVGLLVITPLQADPRYTPTDVALVQTVGGVLASALDNARLFAQARTAAAEQERRRLARELHDSVSQALFAASRIAETLPHLWELDPDEGRDALSDLHRFTTGALAEMRALLVELRPHALVSTPLHETLAVLAPTAHARGVADVQTTLAAAPLLPPDVQIALYRVAQEALSNVIKHARAQQVAVQLEVSPPYIGDDAWHGAIRLSIYDNGRGFVPGNGGGAQFGLAMMRERAAEIGALLTIESAPGNGARIAVDWRGAARSVPLDADETA